MTMQTSGAISIGQAQAECRESGTIDAGNTLLSRLAGVSPGQRYAWSYWYGKSFGVAPVHGATIAAFDLNCDNGAYIAFNLTTMAKGTPSDNTPAGSYPANTGNPDGQGTINNAYPFYDLANGGTTDARTYIDSYSYFNTPYSMAYTPGNWGYGLDISQMSWTRAYGGNDLNGYLLATQGNCAFSVSGSGDDIGAPWSAIQPNSSNNWQCSLWYLDFAGSSAHTFIACVFVDLNQLSFSGNQYTNFLDSQTGYTFNGFTIANGMVDRNGNIYTGGDWNQCAFAMINGRPIMGPRFKDLTLNLTLFYGGAPSDSGGNKTVVKWNGIFVGTVTGAAGGGGGASCFVAGSLVLMADRSWKQIQTIQAGDIVMGPTGPATVKHLHVSRVGEERKLLMFEEDPHHQWSAEHPHWVRQDGKDWWWVHDHVQIHKEIEMGLIRGLKDPHSFLKGPAEFASLHGFVKRTPVVVPNYDPDTQVFIPVVEGSPVIVNGYVVSAFINEFGYDYHQIKWDQQVHDFVVDRQMLNMNLKWMREYQDYLDQLKT